MGGGRRLNARPFVIVALAFAAGCKKAPVQAAPSPAASQQKPAAHLAPDELLEGSDSALGLILPRGARIKHRFVDQVFIEASLPFDKLLTYVQAHVTAGTLSKGERKATFDHVRAKESRELRVVIEAAPFGLIRMEIRDITQPIAPILPDEEARWRAAGMSRDGKILNRKQLE